MVDTTSPHVLGRETGNIKYPNHILSIVSGDNLTYVSYLPLIQ